MKNMWTARSRLMRAQFVTTASSLLSCWWQCADSFTWTGFAFQRPWVSKKDVPTWLAKIIRDTKPATGRHVPLVSVVNQLPFVCFWFLFSMQITSHSDHKKMTKRVSFHFFQANSYDYPWLHCVCLWILWPYRFLVYNRWLILAGKSIINVFAWMWVHMCTYTDVYAHLCVLSSGWHQVSELIIPHVVLAESSTDPELINSNSSN